MALVTIQRSPSPSNDPESEDTVDGVDEAGSSRSPLRQRRSSTALKKLRKFFNTVRFITKLRPCLSESYFTVKGAALILPQNEYSRKTSKKNHGGDMQHHLQTMLHLLRPEDKMKMAVKLENSLSSIDHRYLALVSTIGREDGEEFVILGIDCKDVSAMNDVASCKDVATIGLVLPVLSGVKIRLDGDGGFSVQTHEGQFLFKPVSVQVMWSALQSLDKAVTISDRSMYTSEGLSHTWISYYMSKIDTSDKDKISQWHTMEGVVVNYSSLIASADDDCEGMSDLKRNITRTLYEIMMTVDLETATCVALRNAVESKLEIDIKPQKTFFDSEVMRILGQLDRASQINEFIYLGSEWNAANASELKELGIGYILNVTKEIDNFFQGMFKYKNIRLQDVPESDLLKHWDKTYDFIDKARKDNSKILVHCKMGISRSASTTMAFLMKDNKWCLDEAYSYVKEKRGCVKPNKGFMEQLKTYEGILKASNQRVHFHSLSERERRSRTEQTEAEEEENFLEKGAFIGIEPSDLPLCKPKGLDSDYLTQFPLETDFETESRSAESMEESLPDVPSPTPETETSGKSGSYDFQTGMMRLGQHIGGREAPDSLTSDSSDDEELNKILMTTPAGSSLPFKDDHSWIKPTLDEEPAVLTEPPVLILAPDFAPSTSADDSKSFLVNMDIYQKEDIPWNSGKVQEIRNVLGNAYLRDTAQAEPNSESIFSKSPKEGVKVEIESANASKESCQSVEGVQNSDVMLVDSEVERPSKRQCPVSVYDMEQIELPEKGIVRKTRLQIEGRDNRPENNDDQDEASKPIQRSSSLKESTEAKTEKAKAKRAERRKTCSPIVSPTSPSPSNQMSANTVGGSDSPRPLSILKGKNLHSSPEHAIKPELYIRGVTLDESTDAEVENIKVFKCGSDEITLPTGIVKKCKQEFETMVTCDSSEMEIGSAVGEQKDGATMVASASGYSHIPTTHQVNSSAKTINIVGKKTNSETCAPDSHNPLRIKKEKCHFDEEEMDYIHEVGLLLGAKPTAEEADDATGAVFNVVRDFERKTKSERKQEKKIVIIDSEGKKLHSASTKKHPVVSADALKLDLKDKPPRQSKISLSEEIEISDSSLSPADEKSTPNDSPIANTQMSLSSHKQPSVDSDQYTTVKLLLDKFEPKDKSPLTENSKTPLIARPETDKPQDVLETKTSPDETLDESEDSKYISPEYVEMRNRLQSVGRSFTPQKDQESPTGVQRLDTRTKSVSDATPPTEASRANLNDDNRKIRRLQPGSQSVPTRLGANTLYNTM